MATTDTRAAEMAEQAARSQPADRLLERLAEIVGGKANVQAVFGEPVRNGDLSVVPVARVRWGFGGGGGQAEDSPTGPASGSGGGGGATADPIGYLEIASGSATFRPIREPYPSPALILSIAVAAALVLRALARLVKR